MARAIPIPSYSRFLSEKTSEKMGNQSIATGENNVMIGSKYPAITDRPYPPANPIEGDIYEDNGIIKIWNGRSWLILNIDKTINNGYTEMLMASGKTISIRYDNQGKIKIRVVHNPTKKSIYDRNPFTGNTREVLKHLDYLDGMDVQKSIDKSEEEISFSLLPQAMEDMLKEVCLEKYIDYVSIEDKLEQKDTLNNWIRTDLILDPSILAEATKKNIYKRRN